MTSIPAPIKCMFGSYDHIRKDFQGRTGQKYTRGHYNSMLDNAAQGHPNLFRQSNKKAIKWQTILPLVTCRCHKELTSAHLTNTMPLQEQHHITERAHTKLKAQWSSRLVSTSIACMHSIFPISWSTFSGECHEI